MNFLLKIAHRDEVIHQWQETKLMSQVSVSESLIETVAPLSEELREFPQLSDKDWHVNNWPRRICLSKEFGGHRSIGRPLSSWELRVAMPKG
jgi:hypothetical protein